MSTRKRTLLMWVAMLVFPPLGLFLLWSRGDWGVTGKLISTVAGLIIFAMWVPGLIINLNLHDILGYHVDWNGNFSHWMVNRDTKANVAEKLEADRAKQHEITSMMVPAPEPPAPAASPAPSAPAVTSTPTKPSYWTDFRGPNRAGIYAEADIFPSWPPNGPERLWKEPIGGGYASITFGDGRAYTIEQRRDKEAITAYDPATGRELWAFTYAASFDESLGGPGPRATPVFHDGLLYSLGAVGDFYCLDARTGKPRWSKNILTDNGAKNPTWAMSGSPLIIGDMVIVAPGGTSGKSLVAYKRLTGEPVWRSLSDRAGYTSPILAELAGRRQIVWISAERVVGAAIEDGKQLWEYPFPSQMDMNCSQPVPIDATHVLLSSEQGPGSALLEIQPTETGLAAHEVWKSNRFRNKFNSSVLRDGYAYGFDGSILACLEVKTGELKWKGGRYGFGQVLLASDRLIVLTEQGELVLVRATPESHQELARFQAIEGKTWNIPAIDHGLLLVRNASEMACYRIGK
jgi:outer membrane protein assembly factor BamB